MASVYDEELIQILHAVQIYDMARGEISMEEAVEKIKDNFVNRLSAYIGDDFDHARRILAT